MRLFKAFVVGLVQAIGYSFAAHGLGLNAHGYVVIPLAIGAVSGIYVFRREQ